MPNVKNLSGRDIIRTIVAVEKIDPKAAEDMIKNLADSRGDFDHIAEGYVEHEANRASILRAFVALESAGQTSAPAAAHAPKRPTEGEPDPNVAKIVKALRAMSLPADGFTRETAKSGAGLAAPDFDRAWNAAIKAGTFKHNGKRGAGARYSLA